MCVCSCWRTVKDHKTVCFWMAWLEQNCTPKYYCSVTSGLKFDRFCLKKQLLHCRLGTCVVILYYDGATLLQKTNLFHNIVNEIQSFFWRYMWCSYLVVIFYLLLNWQIQFLFSSTGDQKHDQQLNSLSAPNTVHKRSSSDASASYNIMRPNNSSWQRQARRDKVAFRVIDQQDLTIADGHSKDLQSPIVSTIIICTCLLQYTVLQGRI